MPSECFTCWTPDVPLPHVLPPGELNAGQPICDQCSTVRHEIRQHEDTTFRDVVRKPSRMLALPKQPAATQKEVESRKPRPINPNAVGIMADTPVRPAVPTPARSHVVKKAERKLSFAQQLADELELIGDDE